LFLLKSAIKNIKSDFMDLTYIIWKEKDVFQAYCLNTDLSRAGRTKEEALASLDEALERHFNKQKPKFVEIQKPEIIKAQVTI